MRPHTVVLFAFLAIMLASCSTADPLVATPPPPANSTRTPRPTVPPDALKKLPPPGRTKGNPDAQVTLVIYSDFQCKYCRQYWRDTEPQLERDYIQAGKISYTFKYFPVIDQDRIGESHWAAYAAECANDQGRFWDYADKLFAEWGGENSGWFTRDHLKQYAADLKLDLTAFNQCLDTDKYATLVYDHLVEALQLKLPGAPMFLLNGRKMDTPTLDYAEFWKPIEAELKTKQPPP